MDQKQVNKMTALDRIEAMESVLDKLSDIPGGGRSKCGYIWVMNDLLTGLHHDILIMSEKLASYEKEEVKDEKGNRNEIGEEYLENEATDVPENEVGITEEV